MIECNLPTNVPAVIRVQKVFSTRITWNPLIAYAAESTCGRIKVQLIRSERRKSMKLKVRATKEA